MSIQLESYHKESSYQCACAGSARFEGAYLTGHTLTAPANSRPGESS